MNIIRILNEINVTVSYLKFEFEMKDLGKTRFGLGLELENRVTEILICQSAYVQKMLMLFNIDKAHALGTPMITRSLDITKDPFRQKDDDEEVLGAETPYLDAIGTLLYLAQCTQLDIAFIVPYIELGLFFPYSETRVQKIPLGISGTQLSASHRETVSNIATAAGYAHSRLVS
ncbi:PREDICTED: uncharacterized protein LOC101300191 [Fragaria vesca subsp. vesca]